MAFIIAVSDLHGNEDKYRKLFKLIMDEKPDFVFIGGDILPFSHSINNIHLLRERGFINRFLRPSVEELKGLTPKFPEIFIILGNDDPAVQAPFLNEGESERLWHYMHNKKRHFLGFDIYGYNFVPPTPFALKDWERYDVSRYADPGCVAPTEGRRSVHRTHYEMEYTTISEDLDRLAGESPQDSSIWLFHSPPYETMLDRAALDNKHIDHVPVDVHVGSIAIRRFIDRRQPFLTFHGHVHESTRLTGSYHHRLGNTLSFQAASEGDKFHAVIIDTTAPENHKLLKI
ncbi:MAG: metallophosphoesterase family protein [Bacteroidota bacterium]